MTTLTAALAAAVLVAASPAGASEARDYTAATKPAEIYAAYRESVRACPAILKAFKSDQALYDALNSASNREDRLVMRRLIEASPAAATPAVKTLLANFDDFNIDSYEGGLEVGVDLRRWLERIEAKGPSEESWKLRLDHLKSYAVIDTPWCMGLCESPSFDALTGAITDAKKLYGKKPYAARLSAWILGVAQRLEGRLAAHEAYLKAVRCEGDACVHRSKTGHAEMTKDAYDELADAFPEQSKEVRGWIDLLKSFAADGQGNAKR